MIMYSVLIIDDEMPVREAIKIVGAWKEFGVTDIYEAGNGKQALQILKQQVIHIALVDMKMPELDGRELLKIIDEQYPDLLTIIISGYDDFEYTRQAIRSNVVDYLLKPVNGRVLHTTLSKAFQLLEAKNKKLQESIHQSISLNMSLPKLKEKLFLSLLDSSQQSYYSDDMLALAGLKHNNQLSAIAALRFLNMDELLKQRFHNDMELLYFAVVNVIYDLCDKALQVFSFANAKQERELIVVYTQDGDYVEDMKFKVYHNMNHIATKLKELLRLEVIVGIGTPVQHITELAQSFRQARIALMQYELTSKRVVIKYDASQHESSFSKRKSLINRSAQLKQVLEANNTQLLQSFISEIAQPVQPNGSFTIGEAIRLMEELVLILNDIALEYGVTSDKLLTDSKQAIQFLREKSDYCSKMQYEQMLYYIMEKYQQNIDAGSQQDIYSKLSDIKKYIELHYYEDIKITMFAEKYFLSREYLMKLFKQQYGFGIHEYVQSVRMEKAKELLQNASLKVQDISDMLGFKDKNYFSKAFRNYYEMTPSEYRAQEHK